MKEFVSIYTFLAEPSEVGEWEGEEALAADNLNQLYHAIYDAADHDIETERLEAMLSSVWPQWQHNPQLLELDEDMIAAYLEVLFSQFNPDAGQETFDDY